MAAEEAAGRGGAAIQASGGTGGGGSGYVSAFAPTLMFEPVQSGDGVVATLGQDKYMVGGGGGCHRASAAATWIGAAVSGPVPCWPSRSARTCSSRGVG